MKEFEEKIKKYLLVLILIFFGMSLSGFILPFVMRNFGINNIEGTQSLIYLFLMLSRLFLGAIFGFILYRDCKKEIKNKYLIPILGVFAPIVGASFYFIENYSAIKSSDNGK